jgi:hypothetical protein
VDIYIASHHGFDQSGSKALVYGIMPYIAIVDNGAKKGGSPIALDIIKSSSMSVIATWQLHFSEEAGAEHNTAHIFIANLQGPDAGNYLKLTAKPNAEFTIFNSRTNKSTFYDLGEKLRGARISDSD